MTIGSLLHESISRIATESDSPALEAQVLLADLLQVDRAWLLAHREETVSDSDQTRYHQLIDQLINGIPLPYLLGKWEFFGLEFYVTPDVLIPRPETELLVEHALEWLRRRSQPPTIADIGTGSGCIAVSIAVHHRSSRVIAADPSLNAINVARRNVIKHKVNTKVTLLQADLLNGITEKFNLICANLPYIPTQVLKDLDVYGREPASALDGGKDGWQVIGRCMETLPNHLSGNSLALFEIEASQCRIAVEHAQLIFPNADVQIVKDLAGKDRLLRIELS